MDNRKRQFPTLLSFIQNYSSNLMKYFYNEEVKFENINQQFVVKKQSKNIPNNIDYSVESDEEFKTELENAVKQYKKNIKTEDLVGINPKCDSQAKQIETKCDKNFDKINLNESEVKFNSDGNASGDVQELTNYFFLQKKDKNEKSKDESYIDYEKLGAIPKNKGLWRESNERDKTQTENIGLKSNKSSNRKSQEKVHEVYIRRPEFKTKNLDDYSIINNSNYDELVVKINEKICSEPFFYIVPENPSPCFFLSRGSYYIIPGTPDFAPESKIIFHPENKAKCDSSSNLENLEIKFSKIIQGNEHKAVQNSQIHTNNLGKEVFRKLDSHLNIGPMDVKTNDYYNNLETNHGWNKILGKNLLKSDSSNTSGDIQRVSGEFMVSDKKDGFNNFEKSLEEVDIKINSLLKNKEKNLEKQINLDEKMMASESFKLRELDNIISNLLSEFPDLDTDSAKVIANEYFLDEEGLKNYIASRHLKTQVQLQKMILALPETSFKELRDKYNEFKGDEELVNAYIQETQRVNKIHQLVLNMLLVLPDADPEFLRLEIEKLNDDENALNTLTCELLERKNYPKENFRNSLSADNKRLWREYVEEFNVKKFILKVPKPENFAGEAGNNNKTDLKFVLNFLTSRYPSKSLKFLLIAFILNNRNITKTCESLGELPFKRLSESSIKNEVFSEAFLKEICYIDHRKEIDEYLKEMKERKEIEKEEARLNNCFLSCPLCTNDELIASEAFSCSEGHVFCKDCIERYICVKMSDGVYRFACPLEECGTFFSYALLQKALPANILTKIISKQQDEEIKSAKIEGLEYCPYCEFAYIPDPEDKIFKCQNPTCLIETCRKCGKKNHIPQRCEEIERSMDVEARKKIEESMTKELVRTCPNCQKKFVKIDGCNKMTCVCGTISCYICRKRVSNYEHFSSFKSGTCPLYSNNDVLHKTAVIQAGIRTKEKILRENQNIRFLYDPTK